MSKFESLIEDFLNAFRRFEEVLSKEKTDIVRDSAIKRFEIVFDVSWKAVKAFLESEHNILCVSPRNCFREAFHVGLIEYDEGWLTLAQDRNRAAHVYDEALIDRIYKDLPLYLALFKKLADSLANYSNR